MSSTFRRLMVFCSSMSPFNGSRFTCIATSIDLYELSFPAAFEAVHPLIMPYQRSAPSFSRGHTTVTYGTAEQSYLQPRCFRMTGYHRLRPAFLDLEGKKIFSNILLLNPQKPARLPDLALLPLGMVMKFVKQAVRVHIHSLCESAVCTVPKLDALFQFAVVI